MRFDARTANKLSAGDHLTIDGSPGLRLEATASRRAWIYRYKSPSDGRMKQIKIGEWPEMSIAAATVAWEGLRAIRDAGGEPAADKRKSQAAAPTMLPQSNDYTVRQLCADYLVGHVEKARTSKGSREIRRMFATMLATVDDLRAESLTRAQAFDLLNLHSGIPVQAGKLRGEMGAAWDYALDAGRLPDTAPNWWRQIMRGRLRSKGKRIQGKSVGTAKRVLTDKEASTLIKWLPNFSRLIEDALTVYLWTGARGSEIVSMAANEINEEPDGLWWVVPKSKTKNARIEGATDLRVPLIGRAEQIVRRRLDVAVNGYLFPSRTDGHTEQKVIQTGVHYHQPYSKTRPKAVRPRLTVTHWAPHDLRRTVRTMLASMGCPREVGESVLGHMLDGVEGTYNLHAYDRERREWLTKISDHMEALASQR